MLLIWIIPLLIFVVVVLASIGVYATMRKQETVQVWRRGMQGHSGLSPSGSSSGQHVGLTQKLKDRSKNFLQRLGQANKPKQESEIWGLRRSLAIAGYRKPNVVTIFLGAKLFVAMMAMGIVLLVPAKVFNFPNVSVLVTMYVGVALLGYYLPNIWLSWVSARRKEKIIKAFPDALDLMVVCVEAGLGLDAAIQRVRDELDFVHQELSDEFNLVAQELRTGVARTDALRNLSRRVDSEEIRSLVALLIQTDRFGTSVAQALRVHSNSMKVNRQLRAEERAAKLPVKLLFPLIFFIFPALFVIIIGPGVIRIKETLLPAMGQS
ncbi:MAG: type II secretion system F family protein [Nitrospiraceae bacterium]